ncbi:MAG: hypothetical protein AB7N65_14380 [Vicinamibacterales bacterium]
MFARYQRHVLGGAAAILCSAVITSAQTQNTPQVPPAGSNTTQPAATPQADRNDRATQQTLVGCLVREKDVPGHEPNVAERAGVLEDYILMHAAKKDAGATASPGAVGTSGSASAAGATGPYYKIEGISDDRLKTFLGKRVEVIGELDADDAARMSSRATNQGATSTAAPAPDKDKNDDWMEFKAASIKEVSGDCPSSSSAR